MAKSKHRRKNKIRKKLFKTRPSRIKVIKTTEKEKLEGVICMLERDANQILEMIHERVKYTIDSPERRSLSYQIDALIQSYNHSAQLFNQPLIGV
jgi:hypothetical protein